MIPIRKDHETEDLQNALLASEALLHQLIGCLSNIQQARVMVATCLSNENPAEWNEEVQKVYNEAINNFVAYAITLGEVMNDVSEQTHQMAEYEEGKIKKAAKKMNTKIHTIH